MTAPANGHGPLSGMSGPLCPGGRCSAILGAIAEMRLVEKAAHRQGEVVEWVIRTALAEVGVDYDDRAVRIAVARAVQRLLAESADRLVPPGPEPGCGPS